jgi:predicted O-methyltransferase YrrM
MKTIADERNQDSAAFDALVETIRDLGTDNLSHFKNGYRSEGGYSLQQNPFELAALALCLKRATPKSYLEIGTASGGVLRFLQSVVGFERAAVMDDGKHHRAPERPAHVAAVREKGCNVIEYIGDSHAGAALQFLADRRPSVRPGWDVAFIDGDHTYAGVSADTRLVLDNQFVRGGGLVVYHDIVACAGDVGRCWREACEQRRLVPVAEYIGDEVPLGIAVGVVGVAL